MEGSDGRGGKPGGTWGFLAGIIRLNLLSGMAYRGSFLAQIVFMMLNNAMFLVFWWIFFSKFDGVRGWRLPDVVMLFSVGASGFGLAVVLFGNSMRLSQMIRDGNLDYYLLLPPDPMVHILMSRMVFSGLGDLVFGFLVFGLFGRPDGAGILLFSVLTVLSATVFASFCVVVHSMSFFVGNTEGISRFLSEALITFSLYPEGLFSGGVKAMLFTVIPAGFVTYVPVRLLREFDIVGFGALLAAAGISAWVATAVFRRGLKRYESGNLIAPRF